MRLSIYQYARSVSIKKIRQKNSPVASELFKGWPNCLGAGSGTGFRGSGFRVMHALGHTEAETWDELRANVIEAVSLHFEHAAVRPRLIQMHRVKDELVPVEAA